jgi:SAM-dependent methyltransferase
MNNRLRALARRIPGARRLALRARFGNLHRTAPLTSWGDADGATAVDRWYIQSFLRRHANVVHGRVLEVKSDLYATSLGAEEVEVLDIDPTNTAATLIGDVCDPATLAPGGYDAAIVTQTLQLVRDPMAALNNLLGALRPGGTLLVTVPCLSRLAGDWDRWRWTPTGFAEVVASAAPPGTDVEVVGVGNGLAARAFLFGLSVQDLDAAVLAVSDPDLPLIVTACLRVRG